MGFYVVCMVFETYRVSRIYRLVGLLMGLEVAVRV